MNFTYSDYVMFLLLLKEHGYHFASYLDCDNYERSVIIRHDIDNDISKAYQLAAIEYEKQVHSTYFVLITSDFYNVFSHHNRELLKTILGLGHSIGLHFDEQCYKGESIDSLKDRILREKSILESAIDSPVMTVSMHRPSCEMLEADIRIPGMINSYSKKYFREYKYLSDSRRRWREPVIKIIESEEYQKLHILTHAFWYNDKVTDLHDSVYRFVNSANELRYFQLQDNMAELSSVMPEEEIV